MNDFYTDPQIHTKSGKGFGEGNLGKEGIYQFVKTHQCNPLCSYLKLEPLNSSRRMLLRGTLPVVQLEFDKNTQSAVIKDDGSNAEDDEERGVQHPLQPSESPASPARRENSWQAAQPPPTSALEAHGVQEQAQNPLKPGYRLYLFMHLCLANHFFSANPMEVQLQQHQQQPLPQLPQLQRHQQQLKYHHQQPLPPQLNQQPLLLKTLLLSQNGISRLSNSSRLFVAVRLNALWQMTSSCIRVALTVLLAYGIP